MYIPFNKVKTEVLSSHPPPLFMKIWLEVQPPYPKQKGWCTLCICKKRKLVDEETTLMKRKKEEKIKCINNLNKDAKKMYTKAEEIQNFNLLVKVNSFRKQSWKNRKF